MRDCVNDFINGAPQSDDLTMLCVRYFGPAGEKEISKSAPATALENVRELDIEAEVAKLPEVMTFLDTWLEEAACPLKAQMQLDVAIDELFTNVASYAYPGGTGEVTVRFACEDRLVSVTFFDRGIPFNPLDRPDPDVTLPASERKQGGLGIFLVRKTMDAVQYRYESGQNILTIQKHI